MDEEKLEKTWAALLRETADQAVKELDEVYPLSPVQRKKATLLFRQFLCDRAEGHIYFSEATSRDEAREIRDRIYATLMEETLAGAGVGDQDAEIARFLLSCTLGVCRNELFGTLFAELLGPNCPGRNYGVPSLSAGLMDFCDKRLKAFAEKEKRAREERTREYNGPPLWMDEFEYIDWVMTH